VGQAPWEAGGCETRPKADLEPEPEPKPKLEPELELELEPELELWLELRQELEKADPQVGTPCSVLTRPASSPRVPP
jgi:hypothetical protein